MFIYSDFNELSLITGCIGEFQVIFGDGPLPMAIFELLEYIVHEVIAILNHVVTNIFRVVCKHYTTLLFFFLYHYFFIISVASLSRSYLS